MSLDSIVRITITTQTARMSQAGFGTPLIIAQHNYWAERVRSFSNLSELVQTQDSEEEKKLPESQRFEKQPLYHMTQAIFAQNPSVPKIKIGKREGTESVKTALENIIKVDVDGDFYGVLVLTTDRAKDYPDLADAIGTRRLLAGVDLSSSETALADKLKESNGARRIFAILKEDTNDYPAAALMGRMLTQAPGSSSWAFKELAGIKKSKLSSSTIDDLKKASINRHLDINQRGVTMDGRVMNNEYIDIIHGIDWLHVRLQERIFRLFVLNEKIPYTTKGVDLIRCEIMAQLNDAVYRGFLADDPPPTVSIPDVLSVESTSRENRTLPDVHFSGRIAGAIHEIIIQGVVKP
jgi:hypothetical protein